ncbi:MAG TPA: hypothetical protein VLH19_00495 [Patescibacteria group bacterium]|nr:hypothetical protein [Patescibacteria group bacterium]
MQIQPYLIVPKLIPQPTWGGKYIAGFKNLPANLQSLTIGQSYELAQDSSLSSITNSNELPIELGNASDGLTQEIFGNSHALFSLQSLIDSDPEKVLGKRNAESFGNRMRVLIKFTQAKGNSFQVHVRPGNTTANWKPKPESWYFFEKGKATLGLKTGSDLEKYRQVCKSIETVALELSEKVRSAQYAVVDARAQLAKTIQENSPYQFVNEINIEADTLIDLSDGGTHHSWEEGADIPDGNIVYEVQLNVMDKDCTLRSFDKGKIADDGTIRPIHIDDYFAALDAETTHNDPATLVRKMEEISSGGLEKARLFNSLYYKSSLLQIGKEYRGVEADTNTDDSFHHLFVKDGSIDLIVGDLSLHAEKGASIFIPASTGAYTLQSQSVATLIKTWA